MRVVPRITNDLVSVSVLLSNAIAELLTSIAVTKNKIFVIGGPGQYSLPNIMKGNREPHTAANLYPLPLPSPVDIYLPQR
jgi:hypothetical protein